jgi:hypothetical protein
LRRKLEGDCELASVFETITRWLITPLARAIKVNLANEGTEQRMKEAEVAMKKRKAEEDARWEGKLTNFLS